MNMIEFIDGILPDPQPKPEKEIGVYIPGEQCIYNITDHENN